MKPKSFVFGLLIGLLAGFADGCVFLFQTEIRGLRQDIDVLKAQNSELQSQLSSLRNETGILGVYFSPGGGCADQVIYWINRANISVHVLIYSFTLDSIGDALIDAYARGVDVKIVFEKTQISEYSEYSRLKVAGIDVRNDTNSYFMHNKVMIVDSVIVLTGSFNWSSNAEENNDENLIVINSTYIARIYEEEFEKIWIESV